MFYLHAYNMMDCGYTGKRYGFQYNQYLRKHDWIVDGAYKILMKQEHKYDRWFRPYEVK